MFSGLPWAFFGLGSEPPPSSGADPGILCSSTSKGSVPAQLGCLGTS